MFVHNGLSDRSFATVGEHFGITCLLKSGELVLARFNLSQTPSVVVFDLICNIQSEAY